MKQPFSQKQQLSQHGSVLRVVQGERVWLVGQTNTGFPHTPELTFRLDMKSTPHDSSLMLRFAEAGEVWHLSAEDVLLRVLKHGWLPELWRLVVEIVQSIPTHLKPIWLEHYCSGLVLKHLRKRLTSAQLYE